MSLKMYGWKDNVCDLDGLVVAESASKARYLVYLQAKDTGYNIGFPNIRILREPELDDFADCDGVLNTIETNDLYVRGIYRGFFIGDVEG